MNGTICDMCFTCVGYVSHVLHMYRTCVGQVDAVYEHGAILPLYESSMIFYECSIVKWCQDTFVPRHFGAIIGPDSRSEQVVSLEIDQIADTTTRRFRPASMH